MKRTVFIISALWACTFTAPAIVKVELDTEMLHNRLGTYQGKVSYWLNPDGHDSAHVSLEVLPAGGGAPLALQDVEGDTGNIQVRGPNAEMEIFFKHTGQPIGQYVARVKADVVVTKAMQDANTIVNAASLTDMVRMFSGDGDFFKIPGISVGGLTMPNMMSQDGPHGYNKRYGDKATAWLTDGGVACTWDPAIAYEQGAAMAKEFRAFGRNCALGPAMNIVWHPRLGRAFEYYSEDSFLSGKLAAAATGGIQSSGVIPTLKHFVSNNMESDRQNLSSEIDERSLRELFLPQFREAVIEAQAYGVMSAYNSINGNYCSGNKYLIDDVLRKDWGFKGLSMSDYEAKITDNNAAAMYGVDILVPERGAYTNALFGSLDIKYTQMHARNILWANGKVGALRPGYQMKAHVSSLNSTEHHNMVRKNGAQALILAKNDGNILPIPKKGKKIYLGGPEMDACRTGGGDTFEWESSLVDAFRKITPRQGITQVLEEIGIGATTITQNMFEADYIIIAVGVHGEGEGKDRVDPRVEDETAIAQAIAAPGKKIVLFTGGSAAIPGAWSDAPAILICFGPGQEQGLSIGDVLFGNVNPSGKLAVTFPMTMNQAVDFTSVDRKLKYPPAHTAHGYFKVNAMKQAPLFNFGHGLSYTTFGYSNLSVYPVSIKQGDRITVSVDVANTGLVAGAEIVQLYLSLPSDQGVPVRVQDLRGFKKVFLNPGETKTVTMHLKRHDMSYFKVGAGEFDGSGKWAVLPGKYNLRVATSSQIHPAPAQPSMMGSFTVR